MVCSWKPGRHWESRGRGLLEPLGGLLGGCSWDLIGCSCGASSVSLGPPSFCRLLLWTSSFVFSCPVSCLLLSPLSRCPPTSPPLVRTSLALYPLVLSHLVLSCPLFSCLLLSYGLVSSCLVPSGLVSSCLVCSLRHSKAARVVPKTAGTGPRRYQKYDLYGPVDEFRPLASAREGASTRPE